MVDINELQLGDLVYRDSHHLDDDHEHFVRCVDILVVNQDAIDNWECIGEGTRPIPLNVEFFKENFPDTSQMLIWVAESDADTNYLVGIEVQIGIEVEGDIPKYKAYHPKYLHQFQHNLRECGYTYLANNLKVIGLV